MPEGPVPAVPPSAGPRAMVVISAVMGVLGLVFLGLSVMSAALAHVVGLTDTSTAVVTGKTFHDVVPIGRGSRCDFYRFEVAWADREGIFTICDNPDLSLIRLEVGDEVVVRSVPWSSEVNPEESEGDQFWAVTGLVVGVLLVWLAVAWIRRYRRLIRGTATGIHLSGRVTKCTRNALTVGLGIPGTEGRRLVLLPAVRMPQAGEGDPVEAWSSRRSVLTRQPRGPWVVRIRGSDAAFTHAWVRGPR